jgi:DNA sulfur modification protein DndD
MDVKILGWDTKGLRLPDWEINLDDSNKKKTSLIMMPSGMGKTTTLHLLQYSFCDYSKIIEKKDFAKFQRPGSKNKKGEFNLNIKINNEKYRIKTIFDFENKVLSYQTTDPKEGLNDGLNLPDEIKKYINQEYIEKTFFDLELVGKLFQSTAAIDSINKLYKLYYFEQIGNQLDTFLVKKQDENSSGRIDKKELKELKHTRDRLLKKEKELRHNYSINEKELENLKLNKKKLEKIKIDIENSKESIKEQFEIARENISLAKNDLKNSFDNFYSELKNPMLINNDFREKLINFESNLNNLKIPESVGKAFFDDLIKSDQCLCGHDMTNEMKNKIIQNKESILSEDTWLILSVLKSKIKEDTDKSNHNLTESLSLIAKCKRKLNIEERKEDEIIGEIDDKKYQETIKKLDDIDAQIEKKEEFFKKYFEAPTKQDTPDDDSINKIGNLLKITIDKISEATETENISNKIKLIKDIFKETEKKSLEFITEDLVKTINKEIPRVMPYEKIFVKDIKNKIVLDGQESASAGQLARIGYLFLITLLDRPNFNFPFIVDSPATAMDDISRAEIASTIANHLENQYIGFILPVERDSFADVLVQETNSKVNLIVAFNTIDKDTKILKELASDYNVNTDEFKDGVVSTNNENFFWNFKTKIKGKN